MDIIHLSNLENYIVCTFHYLGSLLSYRTLIFNLMRKLYIYNACIYSFYQYNVLVVNTLSLMDKVIV